MIQKETVGIAAFRNHLTKSLYNSHPPPDPQYRYPQLPTITTATPYMHNKRLLEPGKQRRLTHGRIAERILAE
jgi:hypothetical protein